VGLVEVELEMLVAEIQLLAWQTLAAAVVLTLPLASAQLVAVLA
jgi:hypothetical protein